MKIDRLIGIITILLQRDRVTAPELAERFEVSRRTINRDIEDICRAGIPVVTMQGSGGGISILDSYKVEKTFFTRDELQAVLSGLKGIDSVSRTSYHAGMVEKLSGRGSRVESDGIVMIDLASHYQKPLTQKIESIKAAIRAGKCIAFKYCYEKGEGERRIEPYRLVFRWSSWYAFGYCLDREAFRLFKLNRMWDVRALDLEFQPRGIPEGELDFDGYFSSGEFHLRALFDASVKYRLIEEYGVGCWRDSGDGRLLLERDFASYDNMRAWVFSFGDKVSVLEPERLREDRRRQAEAILRMEAGNATVRRHG